MTFNYADRLSYSLLCRLRGAEGMYPDPLKGVRLDVDRRRINYGDPKGREEGGYELTVTDTDGQQYRVSVERIERKADNVIPITGAQIEASGVEVV